MAYSNNSGNANASIIYQNVRAIGNPFIYNKPH